jgi:hypothetical protein
LHRIKLGGIDYVWIYEGPVVSRQQPEHYAYPVEALFGGGAALIGVDLPQLTMPVDAYALTSEEAEKKFQAPYAELSGGIPVTLYWHTLAQINGEHNIYIRLVDETGAVWGQVDRMILSGLWRPDRWREGYYLRDEYKLPVEPGTPPGSYQLEVGMYDFVTGQSYGVAKNVAEINLTPPVSIPKPENLDLPTTLSAPIDENFRLLGHSYADSAIPPGTEMSGKLFWQVTKQTDRDYLVEFSLQGSSQDKYVITETPVSPAYPVDRWRRNEIVGAAYEFRIPAAAPAGNYPLLATLLDTQTGEAVGPAVTLATVTVEAIERNFELPQNVTPISAVINDEIELVGYNLVDQTVAPRESFGLTLYWRTLRPPEDNYTVFVHAVGPDQVMRGQWDSVPGQGEAPTAGWLPGEVIEDHYQVPMAKDAPPWKYDVFVGMYNPETNERLRLFSPNAPTSDDRVWLTRVGVEAQ